MILGVQILGIIFGLFMAYFSFLHYKRQEFKILQFLFWEIVWFCFILVVIFPKITNGLIHKLGINRTMDLLTILGFMLLTFLTFYNYAALHKFKRKLEEKVREDALKDLNEK
jgi:hypothetical protein